MSTKDNCGKVTICCFYNLFVVFKHYNLNAKLSKKAKQKANFGCTLELLELLFFFPNYRQR